MTTLAHATLVEHQIMEHIKDALRLTLETKAWPASSGRKLASVRFMAESFERHFQRLIDLEEEGGYMPTDRRTPQLARPIAMLREEHIEIRQQLAEILGALRSLSGEQEVRLGELCRSLQNLLDRIDSHDAHEVTLLEQALLARPYERSGQ